MQTKQIIVHEYGSPDVLKVESHEIPEPSVNEVMIHNQYISVDYTDIYWRTGQLDAPQPPLIPGKAGAGVITKVGANVTGMSIGGGWMIDLDGKVKLYQAAEQAGIKRVVLVSAGAIQHSMMRRKWIGWVNGKNTVQPCIMLFYYYVSLILTTQLFVRRI
ncbi:alcohol dehydrogenase catalytic domain-containing protein [uncultured Limosilactobacillus sp.]|uniref:alcohol dehydrogenase catalytic domain-containing protein n=1 Tax=uncultured Limosilactobacillus sp. TaxID=2837629 RepID=UPI0025F70970|nr:alcohol dehydrogenase catalytic domain-containing protein [uncultured Limosilactobacillus sp.]